MFTEYRQTSLKKCIEVFDKFLARLEKTWKGKLIEQSGKKICSFMLLL